MRELMMPTVKIKEPKGSYLVFLSNKVLTSGRDDGNNDLDSLKTTSGSLLRGDPCKEANNEAVYILAPVKTVAGWIPNTTRHREAGSSQACCHQRQSQSEHSVHVK